MERETGEGGNCYLCVRAWGLGANPTPVPQDPLLLPSLPVICVWRTLPPRLQDSWWGNYVCDPSWRPVSQGLKHSRALKWTLSFRGGQRTSRTVGDWTASEAPRARAATAGADSSAGGSPGSVRLRLGRGGGVGWVWGVLPPSPRGPGTAGHSLSRT